MTRFDSPHCEDERHHAVSERTPLISAGCSPESSCNEGDVDPRDAYRWPVLLLALSVVFMVQLSVGISDPANNALLEKAICGNAYPEIARTLVAGHQNPLCKDPAVQGTLAMYKGWVYTLESLPTLLLAVPYGFMSDRRGRRSVAILTVAGLLLQSMWYRVVFYLHLPVWTILLSFLGAIIGGGWPVGLSMLYTMLADVNHVDDMATILFRFHSAGLLADLVSNPLGAWLLSNSPWASLGTGTVSLVVSLCCVYRLPETLVVRRWHDARAGKSSGPPPELLSDDGLDDCKGGTAASALHVAKQQLDRIHAFLLGNKRAVVLIVPFVCLSLGRYPTELLLLYSTERYGLSWSSASYLLTLRSASLLVVLNGVLPACSRALGMAPLSRDLWLGRASAVVLVAALLLVAAARSPALYAPGLVLLAGGCGFGPLLRSLLTALVAPHHVGTLNTLVSLVETLGLMSAAPLFAGALRAGFARGGAWCGLPFVLAAGVAAAGAAVLFLYRVPPCVEEEIVHEDLLAVA